jgi:hypothetical protein
VRGVGRGPAPPNWTNNVAAVVVLGVLILGGGIVYFLAQTVFALQRGSVPAALTAGGLAVFCCGFGGALAVTVLTSAKRYADCSDAGTTVRVHPAIAWSYGIASLGGVVGSACYIAFVSFGTTELPLTTPGRETVNRYLMISLLVLSLAGLAALIKRRETGYLQLGPDAVESADLLRTRTTRWDDIVDVIDKAHRQTRNPIVLVVKDAKPVVIPNADRYASSGGALYWMVRNYWKHPEDRDELTDGRALERLRNEQFDAQ